ncbi:MAG: FlgD immunoglobulin-like domain containing protein, partial [bacterium]
WNGSNWVTGNNSSVLAFQSGAFVEYQLPRANLGSPAAVYVCGAMINEQGGVESTFFLTPQANGPDAYDKDFAHYFGFALVDNIAPDFAGIEDTYPVASITTGDFNIGSTWTGGVAPHNNSNVYVQNGHTITLNATGDAKHLTLISGGTFNATSGTLTIGGDLANNGSFNHNNGTVTFNGTGTRTISGSSTTAFNNLTVALGTGSVLDALSSISMATNGLTLTQGIFKLSSASAITPFSGPETIPPGAGFQLNHAGAVSNWGNSGALALNGSLIVDSGSMTIGSAAGDPLTLGSSTSSAIINGGTLNLAGRVSVVNSGAGTGLAIHGGEMVVTTVGNNGSSPGFEMGPTGRFVMTAGTVTVARAHGTGNAFDVVISSGSGAKSMSGGTFRFGNASTPMGPAMTINSTLTFFNLTVNNPAGVSLRNNATVSNTLTFLNGNINTGSLRMNVLANGTVARTSGHVVGNLLKQFPGGANIMRTFEIGTGSNYAPVDINIASVSGTGSLTLTANAGDHPSIASSNLNAARSVNRSWSIFPGSGLSITTYNATFNFSGSDLDAGVNANALNVGQFSGIWIYPTIGARTATGVQALGLDSFGQFQLAEPLNPPGVTIAESGGSTGVTEDGAADTYTVVLNSVPTANVAVTGDPDNQLDLGTGAGNAIVLTFTPGNALTPQVVTVTAVNDEAAEGNHTGTIMHTAASTDANYNGIGIGNVVANITDNEAAGVTIVESAGTTVVTEGGAADTYTIVLNSVPTANVAVTVDSDGQLDLGTGAGNAIVLTFTPANALTPQVVTVTANDDLVAEGNHTGAITHLAASPDANYHGVDTPIVTANITDNDLPLPSDQFVILAATSVTIDRNDDSSSRGDIHSNGTIRFLQGDPNSYFFNRLQTKKKSELNCDVAGGEIEIHVVTYLKFGERVKVVIDDDGTFLHPTSPGPLPKSRATEEENVAGDGLAVTSYRLEQNHPNPFNPTTRISFALPEAGEVTLTIFNSSGQLVRRLVDREMAAGRHSVVWDAKDQRGMRVSSGVYMYVLKAGSFVTQRKLVLMK